MSSTSISSQRLQFDPSSLYPLGFIALWSTGFIGAKFGLADAEPLTFLALRYGVVILLMAAVVLAARAPWPKQPKDFLHIGISGLLIHGVYLGGVFFAIHGGLPAGITALVVGLQPLATALLSRLVLKERIGPTQWAGLVLGFIGISLVVAQKANPGALKELAHMLAPALIALLSITVGTLYQKKHCPTFDLRTGSIIQFAPCLLLTGLAASLTETMHIHWTPSFIFSIAWLVLVISVGAVTLLNLLIRQGSAVRVASLLYLSPPTTALIAWALFGESLGFTAAVGMVIAVAGVWISRKQSH